MEDKTKYLDYVMTCRHKIFNGTFIIDNKKMDYSNNFFFKKSSKKNNFVNDFQGIEKLEIQYEKLFSNKEVKYATTWNPSFGTVSILIAWSAPIAKHFLKMGSQLESPTVTTVTFAPWLCWSQIARVKPNSSFGFIMNWTPSVSKVVFSFLNPKNLLKR